MQEKGVKTMPRPYLGDPKYTIEVLQKYNFAFQKRFGQNFLIDTHVLDKIIDSAQITKDDFVLEIGPGIGTMTQYLAEAAREVAAVEIDTTLIPILKDTLKNWDNVTVINNDILKVDIRKLALEKNQGRPIKVVANLPYYITTPIIMGLFENQVPIDSITIMVQKEVADRMQVGPGTKDYGALSLAVQYYAKPQIVANVPPNCFMPRPKVGSAVIRLEIVPLISTPNKEPIGVPTPPERSVPPITAEEIASISRPFACSTKPAQLFKQNRNPPRPARKPSST